MISFSFQDLPPLSLTLSLSLSLCLPLLFPLGSFTSPDTNQRHRSRTCRGRLTLAAHKSPQAAIMYRNVATWPPLPTSLHSPAPAPVPLLLPMRTVSLSFCQLSKIRTFFIWQQGTHLKSPKASLAPAPGPAPWPSPLSCGFVM